MYAIRFTSLSTRENYVEGIYETIGAAQESLEFPEYGSLNIEEISDEEALQFLINQIDEYVDVRRVEEGDVSPDEYVILEHWFFEEVNRRIKDKEPGWELLQKEYI